jgi:hypothetical protein
VKVELYIADVQNGVWQAMVFICQKLLKTTGSFSQIQKTKRCAPLNVFLNEQTFSSFTNY